MIEPIQSQLNDAIKKFEQNNLEDAEKICTELLVIHPTLYLALYIMGMIFGQQGNHNLAAKFFSKALESDPNEPYCHFNLAKAAGTLGDTRKAIEHYLYAIKLNPLFAEAWCNLGETYLAINSLEDALNAFEKSTYISSNLIEAWINKSIALRKKGDFDNSLKCLSHVEKLNSLDPNLWLNHGLLSIAKGNFSLAINQLNQAVFHNNDCADAWLNMGLAHHQLGELEYAVLAYKKATAISPNREDYLCNLGVAYMDLKEYMLALDCFNRCIEINSNFYAAYFNKSLVLLLNGNFNEGWILYENRLKNKTYDSLDYAHLKIPSNLNDIKEKKILVIKEQGYGDNIQFSRYLPILGELCDVTFLSPHALTSSFLNNQKIKIVETVLDPLDFDYRIPLLSLPKIFKTQVNSIPKPNNFIGSKPEKVNYWHNKLNINKKKLNIGVAISGNPKQSDNNLRSLQAKNIKKWCELANLYIIQKDINHEDLSFINKTSNSYYLGNEISDFSDTAAIIENMDLIVSVCTSIIHLAGTLNKNSILICRWAPDWRWMLDRNDSPWYPSIKIIRQTQHNNWTNVIEEIYDELNKFADMKGVEK